MTLKEYQKQNELLEERTRTLQGQIDRQVAEVAKLEGKIRDAEKSLKYHQDAAISHSSTIQEFHTILDSLGIPRNVEVKQSYGMETHELTLVGRFTHYLHNRTTS
jgi:chromosome segregation ATPase